MSKKILLLCCLLCCLAIIFWPKTQNIIIKPIVEPVSKPKPPSVSTLNQDVLDKALLVLQCSAKYNLQHTPILTIIDYSLPSNVKRLWVFDLAQQKILFHTYVAHGINSGAKFSKYFSNKYNSKASSIGVYTTGSAYAGREGVSLKLVGLDTNFNDNAANRAVVMHGGWYAEEWFIQKYGRAGRSWGCPALPLHLTSDIINRIKENGIMLIYYPHQPWLQTSKYLNCNNIPQHTKFSSTTQAPFKRKAVLIANETVVAMNTSAYRAFFVRPVPLTRMLRRQINQEEYVALSDNEVQELRSLENIDNTRYIIALNSIEFIRPVVTMRRGYYITEMHKVVLGHITTIQVTADSYKFYFTPMRTIEFKLNNKFIRWIGL